MTTLPFGTNITLSAAPSAAPHSTPTVVGVIGLAGTGATGSAGVLHLAHTKAEMLTLVGSDGELHDWAEEFYSRDSGQVLVSIIPAYTANDDSARDTAASGALDLFLSDVGTGIRASIIDIGNYGTNVESGSETDASTIVAKLETTCEVIHALGLANYPATSASALQSWATGVRTWLGNNRKPRVLTCGGAVLTAANSGGIAASTVLAAKRADLDRESGITMPLVNKPVVGIVGTYPVIPYRLDRTASVTGRTLQDAGLAFMANFRGWKTVVGELAAPGGDNKRYESILRAVDLAVESYRVALGSHLGDRNRGVERGVLEQTALNTTASLIADDIIEAAEFSLDVSSNATGDAFRVTLRGQLTTIKGLVQIDVDLEVD